MIRRLSILLVVSLCVLCIWATVLLLLTPTVQAEGQAIHFNGQMIDLSDASNVVVQSSNEQHVFAADEQGGAVTVTTSIITVTVWMKP